MPPKYITPDMVNQNLNPSGFGEIDKGIKALDQVTNIVNKESNLLDKIGTFKKNKEGSGSDVMKIENKANKMATQKINQQIQTPDKIVYRMPNVNYQKMSEEFLKSIEELVKKNEKKTVKEYYDTELIKLKDSGILPSVIQQFIERFIEND